MFILDRDVVDMDTVDMDNDAAASVAIAVVLAVAAGLSDVGANGSEGAVVESSTAVVIDVVVGRIWLFIVAEAVALSIDYFDVA